jgi:twitching motility protein PilT
VEGLARFRANIFRQQSGFDGIFRAIQPEPPTLEDLGLPQDLARFTNYHQGMVLITGPTGCGKSSTLAALVDLINEERKEHLLTIEDPIEYQYTPKRCIVNQRSVHRHTGSFARALRAALREDPDVIVIGELRDLETISLAMTAAETGHFVLATLHTGGAIRTLNRLIGSFPSNQQDQVRKMLSESLRAVISQRLVRKADGSGQTPALETLVVTKAVGNLIRENKTFQIQSILQTGAAQGMVMLDQSIRALVKSGTISREEALLHVEDPKILGGS